MLSPVVDSRTLQYPQQVDPVESASDRERIQVVLIKFGADSSLVKVDLKHFDEVELKALLEWCEAIEKFFSTQEEVKRAFAIKLCTYLELADQDSEYRTEFFATIQEFSSCSMGIKLAFFYFNLQYRLAIIDSKDLANLLKIIKDIYAISLVETFAIEYNKKMLCWPLHIRTYCAYLILFKDHLNLEVDLEVSARDMPLDSDLKAKANFIESQLAGEEFYKFLIMQKKWLMGIESEFKEDHDLISRSKQVIECIEFMQKKDQSRN